MITFKCEICAKEFKNNRDLKRHLRIHSEIIKGNEKEFKCDICDLGFQTADYLERHQQSHTNQFKCEKCTTTFKYKTSLQNHNIRVIC